MWQTNLIKLYCAVCDNNSTIEAEIQRQNNNFRPEFTDEECITVYLWGISQRRFEQKTIYEYTKNHLLEWFPKLPSYQAFSDRLNRLAPVFQALAEIWLYAIGVDWDEQREYIVDSCSVILAKGPRSGHGKVARELCEKKLQFFQERVVLRNETPRRCCQKTGVFTASALPYGLRRGPAHLPAAKQILEDHIVLKQGRLYADKAYIDAAWEAALKNVHAIELITPRKKRKENSLVSGNTSSTLVVLFASPSSAFSTGSIV